GLTDKETAFVVAIAGVLIGLGFAATQALLAPRIAGGPKSLVVGGSVVAACGYAGAIFAPTLALLLPTMVIIAVGLGLAIPGFNAGATLAVGPAEHAAVAGQLAATAGLTYIAGPIMGAGLYVWHPLAPIIGAMVLAIVAGVVSRVALKQSA